MAPKFPGRNSLPRNYRGTRRKRLKNTSKAAESHFGRSIATRESINRLAQSGCGSYRERMFADGCETHAWI